MTQNFASTTTVGRFYNPGYEYLMGIYWMKEAQVVLSSDDTRYYLPAKAVLRACLAIDGYVNGMGRKVDPEWETINEETTPVKERLARINNNLEQPFNLNQVIWKDVILLFDLQEQLSRFELESIYGMPEAEVPEIFKEIEQKYPIRMIHAITEEAIQFLLTITG